MSRGWACSDCSKARASLRVASCKGPIERRLCRRFDTSLIRHRPGLSVEEYERLHQDLQMGLVQARGLDLEFPRDGNELVTTAQHVHEVITMSSLPEIAGKLRTGPVWFGHGNIEGADPAKIPSELRSLGDRSAQLLAAVSSLDEMAKWCANFIYRYFAIHPFLDVNGRTGRFLVELAVEHAGYLVGSYNRRSKHDERHYVNALRYADRHLDEDSNYPEHREPFHYLTRWWRERLDLMDEDWDFGLDDVLDALGDHHDM